MHATVLQNLVVLAWNAAKAPNSVLQHCNAVQGPLREQDVNRSDLLTL